jgi:hypothetical protein
VFQAFGRHAGRNSIRRVLRRAKLRWKRVKKRLGKAKPEKRAAHVDELLKLFAGVCAGEVILIDVDEVHVHRDRDLGYTWGRKGQRLWRTSDCPRRSDRMNAYGAYDFTHGECLLWQDGWCDGERTVRFLRELARWRAGQPGRWVLIWDNAPCHVAKVVTAEAARLGIEVVKLPGLQPGPQPDRAAVGRDARGGHARLLPRQRAAADRRLSGVHRADQPCPDRSHRSAVAQVRTEPEFEEKLQVST